MIDADKIILVLVTIILSIGASMFAQSLHQDLLNERCMGVGYDYATVHEFSGLKEVVCHRVVVSKDLDKRFDVDSELLRRIDKG